MATLINDAYYALLKQAVSGGDIEEALTESAELGRKFLRQETPPEEVTEIHHHALQRLAAENPDLRLVQVADRLTAPLMEIIMAYSLAFRQQLEAKYTNLMNARLAQTSRLEALGTLAAGIGHDFNTILGIINGYSEMLSDRLPDGSVEKQNAEQIIEASFRARDLIVRMLAFARQRETDPFMVDIVAIVKSALKMIQVSLPPGITVRFDTELTQVLMMADPSQIHQVVINLCMNAVDATQEWGVIDIRIRRLTETGKENSQGKRFCLEVEDSGCGMPPEVLEHVFDPFFTTKPPGKGSGLGLSVVYGIVSELQGDIDIQSRVGKGTTFSLSFPYEEQTGPSTACC